MPCLISTNLCRKCILNLTPYVPGKPIEEVKRELGIDDIVKLASNENPLGPSPAALEAMKCALESVACTRKEAALSSGRFWLSIWVSTRIC